MILSLNIASFMYCVYNTEGRRLLKTHGIKSLTVSRNRKWSDAKLRKNREYKEKKETCCTYQIAGNRITVTCQEEKHVTGVSFEDNRGKGKKEEEQAQKAAKPGEKTVEMRTPLSDETARQLEEYFQGTRKTFDLPLRMNGTEFQKQVWEALLTIPYGETRSYSELAEQIGRPKAARAVGMANHRNPIAILVPCHRVIGKNGSLTGYAGGIDKKEMLLELEKSNL